ncbi:cysteine desulfurase family protein [Herbiconiux ginsengi]|uniref:cysteine desulfurase n=1 Tax=Herbiconiux ginsengi TaxID=381665 RepID=A0A1H3MKQ5_9MICO|nr:cysteine desulfurase family protein [Herbiconiux ginsengi]SDY76695.1 cysteine desulfurase [Herbiconiux ginsengi]
MIYLDAAATTPVKREVLEAMWPFLTGDFGNPSSHHGVGESASRALAAARRVLAEWLGCRPAEVVFTSGGTEADNLAVKGIALGNPRGRHVVLSAIEHPAVVESVDYLRRVHGFEVSVVPVDIDGRVDPDAFAGALRPDTTLATVMYANNEIGTVQPVARLAELAHASGVPFHTDAVQAAGWLDTRLDTLGVDALSLSGHKLGAPKGIGVLAVRQRLPLEPVVHGGGQERGHRSGTENVAFAVGLAAAVRLAPPLEVAAAAARTTALRDEFIGAVLATVPGARLTGHPSSRLPSVASFCFPGTSGEAVLLQLEERGVIVSSGSACAAGSDDPSPVLLAIGLSPQVAQTAVRFTLTPDTTAEELRAAVDALRASVAEVAALG